MDWKLFVTAFGAVFLAEIGDKTQLAAFALSGGASSKWTVFFAASLALIAATGIAVVAGGFLERYVPVEWIRRGAGALFIAIGVVLLISQQGGGDSTPEAEAPGAVSDTDASPTPGNDSSAP